MLAILMMIVATRGDAQKPSSDNPIVSAYHRTDEGPGKMQLSPGYVAGLPAGQTCIDTECGHIWNPRGLTIDYDIGGMAGVELGHEPPPGSTYLWYGEATINGQLVRYAVSGADKPVSLTVCFPVSNANFNTQIRNEGEIQTALQMLLTYQGTGYKPEPEGAIDGRIVQRDGTELADVEITVTRGSEIRTTRTDAEGHFRFLGLPPGRYDLVGITTRQSDCNFSPQHWRINAAPGQIQLHSFVVHCR